MSISSISQPNELGEDVLQMIFQQLEGEDLVNCEAVCRQWRDILLGETPWKRLFDRNKERSPSWQRAQRVLEKNQPTSRSGQYRDVCKDVLQVKSNWRTGNFTKFIYLVNRYISKRDDFFPLTIGDDCVAWEYTPSVEPRTYQGCTFLDTELMEITKIPVYCPYRMVNGMLIRYDNDNTGETLNIWNPKFNWNIEEEQEGGMFRICHGSGLLVRESDSGNRERRIEVWKMGNPPTLLRTRIWEISLSYIWKVDERFIVALGISYDREKAVTLYFISSETLEIVTSLSAMNYEYYFYESKWRRTAMKIKSQYDQGLLFQYRGYGIVRTLDVASGTYINKVRIPFRSKDREFIKLFDKWASANSNVMVIGWKYANYRYRSVSHLSVYDLEAVKKPNSDPGSHLLYTLQFQQSDIHSFVMNENELAISGTSRSVFCYVMVLKFLNFSFAQQTSSELKENPKDDGDCRKEIDQLKVKKIHDCVDFNPEDQEDQENYEEDEDHGNYQEDEDYENNEEDEDDLSYEDVAMMYMF